MQYCKRCNKNVKTIKETEKIKGQRFTYIKCAECGALLTHYGSLDLTQK